MNPERTQGGWKRGKEEQLIDSAAVAARGSKWNAEEMRAEKRGKKEAGITGYSQKDFSVYGVKSVFKKQSPRPAQGMGRQGFEERSGGGGHKLVERHNCDTNRRGKFNRVGRSGFTNN